MHVPALVDVLDAAGAAAWVEQRVTVLACTTRKKGREVRYSSGDWRGVALTRDQAESASRGWGQSRSDGGGGRERDRERETHRSDRAEEE